MYPETAGSELALDADAAWAAFLRVQRSDREKYSCTKDDTFHPGDTPHFLWASNAIGGDGSTGGTGISGMGTGGGGAGMGSGGGGAGMGSGAGGAGMGSGVEGGGLGVPEDKLDLSDRFMQMSDLVSKIVDLDETLSLHHTAATSSTLSARPALDDRDPDRERVTPEQSSQSPTMSGLGSQLAPDGDRFHAFGLFQEYAHSVLRFLYPCADFKLLF